MTKMEVANTEKSLSILIKFLVSEWEHTRHFTGFPVAADRVS